jgi:hypothetical protein
MIKRERNDISSIGVEGDAAYRRHEANDRWGSPKMGLAYQLGLDPVVRPPLPDVVPRSARRVCMLGCLMSGLLLAASAIAAGKISLYQGGEKAGHYLVWNDKPVLLIGDSVTQGWMENGTNFNQPGYADTLSSRGINLILI